MLKVAITGNIAAGKSQVEKIIAEQFPVYDADKIAHKYLGNVDRVALGEKIFNDPLARKQLENLIHPKVKQEILEIFKQSFDVVFISVPLLFETGFDELFDKIIFIAADSEIRLDRLMKRNNLTKKQALNRMNIQGNQEDKIIRSDFVIYNNGSYDDLRNRTLEILNILIKS